MSVFVQASGVRASERIHPENCRYKRFLLMIDFEIISSLIVQRLLKSLSIDSGWYSQNFFAKFLFLIGRVDKASDKKSGHKEQQEFETRRGEQEPEVKNFPTWNICITPFLSPMKVYYNPQKVWLHFIKVELYPSQKRGVQHAGLSPSYPEFKTLPEYIFFFFFLTFSSLFCTFCVKKWCTYNQQMLNLGFLNIHTLTFLPKLIVSPSFFWHKKHKQRWRR